MANRTDVQWSVDKFNAFLQRFAKSTGVSGALVLKRYGTIALTRIVARTPVDTGVARYGWSAAGEGLGVKVPSPSQRADAAKIDVGEYEESLTGPRMFIRIANNVPYTIYLEYGWSKQAPLGMVRITMAELRSGQNLTADLMDELRAAWEDTPGASRYRTQARIMGGVLGSVKDMPLAARRPKPDVTRRTR